MLESSTPGSGKFGPGTRIRRMNENESNASIIQPFQGFEDDLGSVRIFKA
jgi:hypothetical protein